MALGVLLVAAGSCGDAPTGPEAAAVGAPPADSPPAVGDAGVAPASDLAVGPPAPPPAAASPLWRRYVRLVGNGDWEPLAPGRPPLSVVQYEAMRRSLLGARGARALVVARHPARDSLKLVVDFATSGAALDMLDYDPSGERFGTLVAFETGTEAFANRAQALALELVNVALTRLNAARAALDAYRVREGRPADLTAGWGGLTAAVPPYLTAPPVNPLNGHDTVAVVPGPDVGWVADGRGSVRLCAPALWTDAFPGLADDAVIHRPR